MRVQLAPPAYMTTVIAAGIAVALAAGAGRAQERSEKFDVASVKFADPGARGTGVRFLPSGRFVATNISLRDLIAAAYGTPQPLATSRIVGGPDWMARNRFNIEATVDNPLVGDPVLGGAPREMFAMLQGLLADRFQLRVTWQVRDMPVYVPEKANTDGRLGPQLRPAMSGCSEAAKGSEALAAAAREGRPAPPSGPKAACGAKFTDGSISAQGLAFDDFIRGPLSRFVDRMVVNATHDPREFDIDIQWTPDLVTAPNEPSAAVPARGGSLFTAMRDQLGLELKPGQAPVNVLVVEQVERPSAN